LNAWGTWQYQRDLLSSPFLDCLVSSLYLYVLISYLSAASPYQLLAWDSPAISNYQLQSIPWAPPATTLIALSHFQLTGFSNLALDHLPQFCYLETKLETPLCSQT
jgi:hypothetical protein